MDNLGETINYRESKRKPIKTGKIIKIEDISPNSGETPQRAIIQDEDGKKDFSVIINAPQLLFKTGLEIFSSNSDVWIKRWQEINDAKISTLPWVLKIDNQRIAMPDLTRDGSKVQRIERYLEENPKQNNRGLKKQCQRIIKRADQADLLLPADDALAVISHPNKKPKLIVLDLGGTEKAASSGYHPDVIKNWNKGIANVFTKNDKNKG